MLVEYGIVEELYELTTKMMEEKRALWWKNRSVYYHSSINFDSIEKIHDLFHAYLIYNNVINTSSFVDYIQKLHGFLNAMSSNIDNCKRKEELQEKIKLWKEEIDATVVMFALDNSL